MLSNLPTVHSEPFLSNFLGSFNFDPVTPEDVVESLISIKSNAIGFDQLHPTFVKAVMPLILPFVTSAINSIFTKGIFPSKWKYSKIIPVPKNRNGTEYRPISILPYLSKVTERLMHKQINRFFNAHGLLSIKQSGFRAHHSSTTVLLNIVEQTRRALDDDKVTFLILLDYSKAFDTIDHKTLCQKLSLNFNFAPEAVKLVYSYLTGRKQAVVSDTQVSHFLSLLRGVPQGSILGPLLFSAYVNDIPSLIRYGNVQMFADDVQYFHSSPLGLIENCVSNINLDLNAILQWSNECGLVLNPLKTKCLVISKKMLDLAYFPTVLLNNTPVEFVHTARNLGIHFNRTLTWNNHINAAVGKAYGALRTLSVAKKFTPIETRKMLAKTLVVPILTYGCEIFCYMDSVSLRKINVAFNNVARYVFGVQRFDHISNYSSSLYGVSFINLLKCKTLTMFFKIVQTKQPPELFNLIQFSSSNRTNQISITRFTCLTTERQFFVNAARLWNSLPRDMRRTDNININIFKKNLIQYFTPQY